MVERKEQVGDDQQAPQSVSRRGFLQVLGVGTMGMLLASACQPAPAPAAPTAVGAPPARTGTTLPAAAAQTGVGASSFPPGYPVTIPATGAPPPDLPSTGMWVDNGYDNYPANPAKFFSEAPGRGGDLTWFARMNYSAAPTPLELNPTWQETNRQLNATVKLTQVSGTDYPVKLATLMAGNDIPDVIYLLLGRGTVPRMSEFLQAQAADLTPYLAGDAIKQYPNLAVIPTYAWKNSGAVVDGKVYLLPIQQYRVGPIMFHNTSIWDSEVGKGYIPQSADDFKRVLQQLNRPQENRWAIGGFSAGRTGLNHGLPMLLGPFGAPNGWRLDAEGKLLRDCETEEYKAAVGFARDLFALGLYHPDQVTFTSTTARNAYLAGRIAVVQESFGGGWTDLWLRGARQNPPVSFEYMVPFPAQSGVKPGHLMTSGFLLANAIKKNSPERVQEILRIMNWLAAPFGTQEDLLVQYGLKDQDYTLDDKGNPVPTQNGPANSLYVGWQFIARHPWTLYYPGLPNFAKVNQMAQQELLPMGVEDPTWGHFSPTFLSRGGPLDTTLTDGVNDIVVGRRPFGDFDQLTKEWAANGGDQIRKEYADLIAAAGR